MLIKCEHCGTNNILNNGAVVLTKSTPRCGACKQVLAVHAINTQSASNTQSEPSNPTKPPHKPEVHTR